MNQAVSETGPLLSRALRVLSELADAEDSSAAWPGAAWRDELNAWISPWLERYRPPQTELIGAVRVPVGPLWHAEMLVELSRRSSSAESPADGARRRFHARMLGHALAPADGRFQPLVTILIPLFNRAGPLAEAVQSCIDQTWRPVEVLVIDDGSTDDVEAALRPFGAQVRLIRKSNGGVASARNVGLRLAQGDFIHLLDSDDLLCPTAIEHALAAFMTIADADLCYGQSQWIDMRGPTPRVKSFRFRELHNPIRSMIVEYAFPVPTVMMPRWRMLAMPPFEEDLFRSSDFRYWQRLGFAEIKVIGIRTRTAYLRRFERSLQATPHPNDDSHAIAVLRGLCDLLRHPHAWLHATEYTNLLLANQTRTWFETAPSPRLQPVLSELVRIVREGRARVDGGTLSMLPTLAALQARIEKLKQRSQWPDRDPACVYRLMTKAIAQAIAGAAPLADHDIAFWTSEPDASIRYHTLHRFFASIKRRCPDGNAAALADALLRRSPRIPSRRAVRMAARLRPVLGARLAGTIAVRWKG
jgi:hypothetical protein